MAGNLFSYLVSPSYKLRLALKERHTIGHEIVSFSFQKPAWSRQRPGQYMEWTLPVSQADSRGARRYFSLASSPTEDEIMVAARFPQRANRFKEDMLAMTPGAIITAGELAGDFTLPRNLRKPLALVAGGIGITPFRSMLKCLSDRREKRDIVLVYSASRQDQLVFGDVIAEAQRKIGLKVVTTVTDAARVLPGWTGRRGSISAEMIREEIPDAARRLFPRLGSPGNGGLDDCGASVRGRPPHGDSHRLLPGISRGAAERGGRSNLPYVRLGFTLARLCSTPARMSAFRARSLSLSPS